MYANHNKRTVQENFISPSNKEARKKREKKLTLRHINREMRYAIEAIKIMIFSYSLQWRHSFT
jgi:hypothetical protein